MPDEADFQRRIMTARRHLELYRLAAESTPVDAADATRVVDELQAAVEELHVADEELRAQAGQLSAAAADLEVAHHRYRELFRLAPCGYIVTDCAGIIREFNDQTTAMLGRSARFLAGKPLGAFITEHCRDDFSEKMAGAVAGASAAWECDLAVPAAGAEETVPGGPHPAQAPVIPGIGPRDRWLPASLACAPLARPAPPGSGGANPKPLELLWVMQDLTPLRSMQERIKRLDAGLWTRVVERTYDLTRQNEVLKAEVAMLKEAAR